MGKPIVYLIGAGPGDPGLMTVKGMRCLAKADVVVYDYLANPSFLAEAREDAELVYVGKKGWDEHMTQAEINQLLVAKALEDGGKAVARLKGGDPFVFGRGGEEALALVEHGIAFEVVPGISSGYAAPAYAGIPVTHRGITADMAFVTGHEDPSKETSDIHWEHLAKGVGTICFFMGVKNLPEIAERLMEHGRKATTPVALVRWGTTPRQETLTGTLADIAEKAEAARFSAPAIIIVGDVVSLRERLSWVERKPLFGRTVVVTRSRTQASAQSELLAELGAEVLEFPTIATVAPDSWELADAAISELETYDWVIFTSVNGVDAFFQRLRACGKDTRALGYARVGAIGPATAERCAVYGVVPDLVPDEYRAEGVLDALAAEGLTSGARVLIPRALEAREVLPDTLRERGAHVDVVPVYRTVLGAGEPEVLRRIAEGTVDAVTFASSSTVRNFLTLLEGSEAEARIGEIAVASIGPITSATARELGLDVTVEAQPYTIPALAGALAEHYARTARD